MTDLKARVIRQICALEAAVFGDPDCVLPLKTCLKCPVFKDFRSKRMHDTADALIKLIKEERP